MAPYRTVPGIERAAEVTLAADEVSEEAVAAGKGNCSCGEGGRHGRRCIHSENVGRRHTHISLVCENMAWKGRKGVTRKRKSIIFID